jgi:hypothetical protein
VLARTFVAIIGGAAIAWGLVTIPIFWQQAPMENVARHIIRGEPYKIDVLMRQIAVAEAVDSSSDCRPIALRSAAIIRLRLVEQTSRGEAGKPVDAQKMKLLDDSIRASLSCSPADPFLWLVLCWVEESNNGFNSQFFNYLRLSYRLGPNEGWIALKRNYFAFTVFDRLPDDLAEDAVNEFIQILSDGFFSEAFEIFTGPGWRYRGTLLLRLKEVEVAKRRIFAKKLYDAGYDVAVPGIEPLADRYQR